METAIIWIKEDGMEIYTMGFTKKSAEQFFEAIKDHGVRLVVDVRINNQSQLAGFTKSRDLAYFLKQLCGCGYVHEPRFSATKEMMDGFKSRTMSWETYQDVYYRRFLENDMAAVFRENYSVYEKVLFLCSEADPDTCHRKLLAEHLQREIPGIEVAHL